MGKFDYSPLSTEEGPAAELQASSSANFDVNEPPPPFEDAPKHKLIQMDQPYNVPQGGEALPPEFSIYQAEYGTDGKGSIISHDAHLNKDGEALWRFCLTHSKRTPSFVLHCLASHDEHRTRTVTTNQNGRVHHRQETYTENIKDFDFKIDVSQYILYEPVIWTVGDEEPAYRGNMYREIDDGLGLRRAATKDEIRHWKDWNKWIWDYGMPPWMKMDYKIHEEQLSEDRMSTMVMKSSRTMREWADEYTASPKVFKEFTYQTVVFGWHLGGVQQAVRDAIDATHYTGKVNVHFDLTNAKIHVRPDTRLSRALSNFWLNILFWILLVNPIIWLFKRFHPNGGGEWRVAGVAFPLKRPRREQRPDFPMQPPVQQFHGIQRNETYLGRDGGYSQGLSEGEFFAAWEGTIRRAVTARLQREEAMTVPDVEGLAGSRLDGYGR